MSKHSSSLVEGVEGPSSEAGDGGRTGDSQIACGRESDVACCCSVAATACFAMLVEEIRYSCGSCHRIMVVRDR